MWGMIRESVGRLFKKWDSVLMATKLMFVVVNAIRNPSLRFPRSIFPAFDYTLPA